MLALFVLLASFANAKESNCNSINTYKDFYTCSLAKHPLFEVSNLKKKEGEALVERAGQFENPFVALKSVGGENAGERVGSSELDATVSVSQFWKREARKSVAEAEKKITDIESKEMILGAKKSLVRDLYRLRQIEEELDLANEALSTFSKIESQFRNRRARGPEQEISLNLVELASGDYELKKNHLNVEKAQIMSRMKALWGDSFEIKKQYLPPVRDKWPELTVANLTPSLEIQKIFADSEKAVAEHSLAVREAWPEFTIGPTVESATTGPNQYYSYGINASITVPILSWNGGSRKIAKIKEEQAQALHKFASNRSSLEKTILLQQYKSAVSALSKSVKIDAVKVKHQRIDNLFRQGLAPGALVIEAHRQINEFTASQHEHENSAIDAFLEVKTLSGEDIEGILE